VNFEVHISKLKSTSDPSISIHMGEFDEEYVIMDTEQVIRFNSEPATMYITRRDTKLYQSRWNYLENKITVERLVIDDFWCFDKDYYLPQAIPDQEYLDHIKHIEGSEWIDAALKSTTDLFFNGSLMYNIKRPIRSMFY